MSNLTSSDYDRALTDLARYFLDNGVGDWEQPETAEIEELDNLCAVVRASDLTDDLAMRMLAEIKKYRRTKAAMRK